ncbi:Crp/Fnr family transcriptional regulator [Iodobacter arcticus]|uniref:Crp/Fnr family transcriptional regulator n=1 Tax=Iodobacter arcticus TaxID=590593 RepID=A0ABW2QSQ5_9NEIS
MPTNLSALSYNRLLAALPSQDQQRFLARCERVELKFSDVLSEPGAYIRHVYFPLESFISLLASMDGHPTLEVGLIGNEGMLGASLALGVKISPLHALVQGQGSVLRMTAEVFCEELQQSTALQHILQRYLYVIIKQLAQTATCSRFHVIEARLARWLLMTQDRAHSNTFHITQKFMAYMLGVRRVGVTTAATTLQNHKLIRYSRGDITILDRKGLKMVACQCYEADKDSYSSIMNTI